MGTERLRNIRKQLLRRGRSLDVARWNYHFEDEPHTPVLKALYAYQNTDGGFGHGLEPDNQNPASTPIATWAAIEILRELGFPKDAGNMMDRITNYLLQTQHFDGVKWRATVPENDAYPHAPWWSYREDDDFGYNPTAALIGFLLRFGGEPARDAAEKAFQAMATVITASDYQPGVHELANLVTLTQDLAAIGREADLPESFYEHMHRWVYDAIDRDEDAYREDNYYTPPDRYIMSRESPYYAANEDICHFYVGFIEGSVPEDGTWPINWTWGEDPLPPDVARDWRGSLAVSKMLFIQRMTR